MIDVPGAVRSLRHEFKYQISLREDLILAGRLRSLLEHDRHAGKDGSYRVTSLYFDTPYDRAYRQKLNGAARREKFRLRYYGADTGVIRLEKKYKINGLCGKRSARLTLPQTEELLAGRIDFLLESREPLLTEFYSKIRGQGLEKKTIVCYDREAFCFEPGNVRVTLDRNVRTGLGSTDFLDTNRLKPGALVVGGSFSAKSRQTIQSLGYPVEDVMERERLVWENAKLTAQAVPVLLGMEDGIFLRGKSVLVLGGGRVARALWPVLKERGAVVSAAARNPAQLALAEQAGVKAVPFAEMEPALGQVDLVINTIPAPVIGRRELAALEEGTLVLDLASAPGGVDFAAAKEYFIPARLELGLPGKWFPVQAGRLLGETVREILEEHWEKGGNRQ